MPVDLGTARGKIELDSSGVFSSMQEAGKSIKTFQSNVTTAMLGVGVAVAGVGAAVKLMGGAWAELGRGAGLTATQDKFKRLATNIGSTGDTLQSRLKEATNGMMANAEIMSSATDIMSLGLGKTEDQTVRLASVVGKLGWDMQQVVLTMANNSKMRLDALGLSVEDVNARVAKLRTTGMSLDEAFDLAVIEAGEAKIELLGDSSDRTEGQIKQLEVALINARDAFSATFATEVAADIQTLGNSAESLGDNLTYAAEGAARVAASLTSGALSSAAFVGQMAHFNDLARQVEAAGGNLEEFRDEYYQVFVGGRGAPEQVGAAIAALTEELELLRVEQGRLDPKLERWIPPAGEIIGVGTAVDGVTRGLSALHTRLVLTSNNLKIGADNSGKFAAGMDALTAAANRNQTALDQAAQQAERYSAAFGTVQADYVTERPDADEPLVAPERTVNVTRQISGPTAEQAELAARYREELDDLRESYSELTGGIGTFGMEQEKLNEKIAQTAGEIAHYEGLLAGMPPAVNEVSTAQQELAVNVDAARQALYDELVRIEAGPEIITAYAAATGIMSEAQAEAALVAARLKLEIEALALKMKEEPDFTLDAAMAELDALILKMEQGVTPAASTMATEIPQSVVDMKDAMSEGATTAGASVPAGIDQGIRDNLDVATAAAEDAAQAVIDAAALMFGTNSPSAVFAEIGGNLLAGLGQGMDDGRGEAVGTAEDIAQATIDAWDGAISDAPGVGEAIVDGVIEGVEARRAALMAKMAEIAREAYKTAMSELEASSPSRLFMNVGRFIIEGIIEGIDESEEALYAKLADVADTLYGIGSGVFDIQAGRLEEEIEAAAGAIEETLGAWSLPKHIEEAMLAASPARLVEMLRWARPIYGSDMAQFDELIALAERRNELEEEYARQQEELARLEEQRARLDFLQQQVDLLDLIRENNLSTDILEGLELGLDANMGDIIAAMTQAMEQLVDRTNEELGIASPSTVFEEIGQRVMQGLARGLALTAGVERQVRQTMARMVELGMADTQFLAAQVRAVVNGPLRVEAAGLNPAQTINIYGGLQMEMSGRPKGDPLRDLYFQQLGYQG